MATLPSTKASNVLSSQSLYRTSSLYEASYLRTKGFKLVGKEQAGPKCFILFEATPNIEQAVHDFYNSSESKRLFDEYRGLKDYMFEHRSR